MNKLLVAIMAIAFVGCASSKKQETAPAQASTSTPSAEAKPTQEPAKKKKKEAAAKKEAAQASTSATASGKALQCANGSDKRSLEIKATDRKGCELHYTKSDATQTIATQVEGDTKCIEVQDRIKSKLEAAGYTCS